MVSPLPIRAADAGGTRGPGLPQAPSFPLLCSRWGLCLDAPVVESSHGKQGRWLWRFREDFSHLVLALEEVPVDVSVIIPTKNEETNLHHLLTDLAAQRHKLTVETLVADAGSTDRTRDVALQAGARVVEGGLPGYGRNRGARHARGEVLYMIDADVRLPGPRFLARTFAEFQHRRLDCGCMDNTPIWLGGERWWTRLAVNSIFDVANLAVRRLQHTPDPRANGPCMIARREPFCRAGGFDEGIYWGEDSELAKRMVALGHRFGVLRSAFAYISPRKPLKQGILTFALNAAKLDSQRAQGNEIRSRQHYQQTSGLTDYFET